MEKSTYSHGQTREQWLSTYYRNLNPFYRFPKKLNQKIWRYMDFTKFVAMLESSSLFFPKASLMEDKFEGSFSKKTIKKRIDRINWSIQAFSEQVPEEAYDKNTQEISRQARINALPHWGELKRLNREWTYINCWHMNNHEYAAMWKLYALSNQAIAIQSTFTKLLSCLEQYITPNIFENPYFGKVYYVNYQNKEIPEFPPFAEYFFKWKSFCHENELRVVIQKRPKSTVVTPILPALSLQININELIEKVYIAPSAPSWIVDLTINVLKRYGLNELSKKVKRSTLESPAIL